MRGLGDEPYYPVFLDLRGRLAVVIGGGSVAEGIIVSLLRYGADVLVIAPDVTPAVDALVAEGLIDHEERGYVRGDLAGAFIVYSATDSVEVDRAVYQEAEGQGCLVSVAEEPVLCNFVTPSVVNRGLLQIAVSTSGVAPELAKRLRRELEDRFDGHWESYLQVLAAVRTLAEARLVKRGEIDALMHAIVDSDLCDRVISGQEPAAEDVFREFVFGDPRTDSDVGVPAVPGTQS
ncbi:MAG: bifunctional precorrin-2 dehydrogenase/sirohydrochlorin ferrochelatase [Coriobacteriia bacterium]|nr:bifunctional precorrin-2 dehydrogenase/sirohydrochlorin ferrochelatase [Coriobacteriia bacterium]